MNPRLLTVKHGAVVSAALLLTQPSSVLAQGCVAVRGGGMCALSGLGNHDQAAESGDWMASLSYRWLHSDRHFVGEVEQTQRQANHTEVINDSHFFDLGLTYNFTPRYSAFINFPFVHSDRSSLYEHLGNSSGQRFHTQAGGLGDVRASGYAWIWDPAKMPKGNIQVGLGLKAPTGESDATDTFTRLNATTKLPTPTLDYVDQSIQPGDGGWGLTVEVNAWREIYTRTYGYLQGY